MLIGPLRSFFSWFGTDLNPLWPVVQVRFFCLVWKEPHRSSLEIQGGELGGPRTLITGTDLQACAKGPLCTPKQQTPCQSGRSIGTYLELFSFFFELKSSRTTKELSLWFWHTELKKDRVKVSYLLFGSDSEGLSHLLIYFGIRKLIIIELWPQLKYNNFVVFSFVFSSHFM